MDVFDVIRNQMEAARISSNGSTALYFPNGHSYFLVECNGGVYFFHLCTDGSQREITTGEFVKILQQEGMA